MIACLGTGLAAFVLAGRFMIQAPRQLVWDGAAWSMRPAQGKVRSGRVSLMLDLGGWMLVRFVPANRASFQAALWLPFRRRDVGGAWRALRVALYATGAGIDAPDGPQRPPAAA